PVRVSGLVERLRQYEGRSWETTHCYNGTRDEAAISIENLSIGLATGWRGKLEAEDALSSERAAHAETKRERDVARAVHRWSVDDVGNGILYVCRNEHDKGDACEWEPFVPLRRAEA